MTSFADYPQRFHWALEHWQANVVCDDLNDTEANALIAILEEHERRALATDDTQRRVGTQEAADILGVSRPTLVRLLDAGALPYERRNSHRTLRLGDVLAYKKHTTFHDVHATMRDYFPPEVRVDLARQETQQALNLDYLL